MYEKETQEAILARMLKNVPRDVDKREGSIIFDAAAPASIEFMLLYAVSIHAPRAGRDIKRSYDFPLLPHIYGYYSPQI